MDSTDRPKFEMPITLKQSLPIGTRPDLNRAEPRRGRYKVLATDARNYLYIPEIQNLYILTDTLAHVLGASEVDPIKLANGEPLSDLSKGAYNLVQHLVERNNDAPLAENRHAHKGLRDVVIHVSQRCNLNCVYCYAVELNKINKNMSIDVADQVIARTMLLAGDDGLSSVKFLGGEPTLAWPVVEHLMAQYLKLSKESGKRPPQFTMVTNGTKITPRIIQSAAVHQMYVLVSIDGSQNIHDTLRPTLGGSGSYNKAMSSVKAFLDAGVNVAIESVYTRQHLIQGITPQVMIEHFLSLGIREFQISPTVGIWHASDTIDQVDQIAQSFAEAARNSVRSFMTASPYVLRGIQFVLDGFSLRERSRYVCGAGRTFMGINYDGEAFPCYLLESPDTSYGFIGKDWDQEKYNSIRTKFQHNGKDYHPVCRECWANEICHSCLGTSWQISPEITKPPAWFCKFQKTIIASVLAEIADARQSDQWNTFLSNMQRYLAPLSIQE